MLFIDFKCEDEGFFPHPRDCKKYFWCLDSGPSGLGVVAHQFTCPSGNFISLEMIFVTFNAKLFKIYLWKEGSIEYEMIRNEYKKLTYKLET